MGDNLAPPLAILFMADLEEKAMDTYVRKPEMYRRLHNEVAPWSGRAPEFRPTPQLNTPTN